MEKITSLENAARLHDEGRISAEEYQGLKREILEATSDGSERYAVAEPSPSMDEGASLDSTLPETRPGIYVAALTLGVLAVFFGTAVGVLAWTAVILSITALAATRDAKGRWMPWTGLALGVLFSISNAAAYGHLGG